MIEGSLLVRVGKIICVRVCVSQQYVCVYMTFYIVPAILLLLDYFKLLQHNVLGKSLFVAQYAKVLSEIVTNNTKVDSHFKDICVTTRTMERALA